jgi:hypothetical protein
MRSSVALTVKCCVRSQFNRSRPDGAAQRVSDAAPSELLSNVDFLKFERTGVREVGVTHGLVFDPGDEGATAALEETGESEEVTDGLDVDVVKDPNLRD